MSETRIFCPLINAECNHDCRFFDGQCYLLVTLDTIRDTLHNITPVVHYTKPEDRDAI